MPEPWAEITRRQGRAWECYFLPPSDWWSTFLNYLVVGSALEFWKPKAGADGGPAYIDLRSLCPLGPLADSVNPADTAPSQPLFSTISHSQGSWPQRRGGGMVPAHRTLGWRSCLLRGSSVRPLLGEGSWHHQAPCKHWAPSFSSPDTFEALKWWLVEVGHLPSGLRLQIPSHPQQESGMMIRILRLLIYVKYLFNQLIKTRTFFLECSGSPASKGFYPQRLEIEKYRRDNILFYNA